MPWFTYSAYGLFTKHCERIQKFGQRGNIKHLDGNGPDKNYFPHDAAYSVSKDLARRNISDKILKGRAYEIARSVWYDRFQRALAIMVYNFLDKKTGSGISVNELLAEELHKPEIKNLKERKSMRDSKTIFGEEIQLKWVHCRLEQNS